MPTYEYACAKCGHEFECFQSIAESPLTTCPVEKCGQKKWGKGKVKRAISAGAGLIFKGSGFYITDYRSESYKQAAKKDNSSAPAATGGGEKAKPATETKAAPAKSETKPAKPSKSA